MEKITSQGFDDHIRKSLFNSGHEFSTEKLDSVRGIFDHALIASKHTELKKGHFEDVLRRMEEHHDWNKLSPGQQEAVVATFRKHLDIPETDTDD